MKKQYFKHFSALAIVCLQMNVSFAQTHFCGATEATKKLYEKHPELVQQEINYNNAITQQVNAKGANPSLRGTEPIYTIPVVFHIIHTYGPENISDAQVIDQVAILNEDWRKANSDISAIVANTPFDTLAADCRIEFRLAQLDPNGNCTNGIDRIYSHKTNYANDQSKLNQWPRDKYLNVWVVKSIGEPGSTTAGYAYYPSAVSGALYPYDGIIILHDYIGSIGTGNAFRSRALTHEVGHWLNLQHPWGNNNDPVIACGDDVVDDTPETMGHTSCDLLVPHCNAGALADIYSFANVTITSGTTDPTAVPVDSGVVFGSPMAVGVSTNPVGSGSFEYSMWDTGAVNGETSAAAMTGAINTGKYYQVTITPWYGYSFSMTAMSFHIARSSTGPRTFAVRAGTFASNMTATITPANPDLAVVTLPTLPSPTPNVFFIVNDTNSTEIGARVTLPASPSYHNAPLTFRIYGWNAEDTLGSFSIDNLSFAGRAGVIENTQNFMDYSYCSVMYTRGQKDRARVALESPTSARNNLWTAENLAFTGTDGTGPLCAPTADFSANRQQICVGSTVTFTAIPHNTLPAGGTVTHSWNLPDGGAGSTPSGITTVKTYNNPGIFPVTLTSTNTIGGGTTTKTDYIRVNPNSPDFVGPYSEPFESDPNYYFFWQPVNYDMGSGTWQLCENRGYYSSQSVRMEGFFNFANDVDDLITPAYNLTGLTGTTTLTFRLAGATRATVLADMNDQLRVYRSIDCGASWLALSSGTFTGAALSNNGYHPEYYLPAGNSDWVLKTINLPSAALTSKVRFKFEYTSGYESNNIYLDDININGTVGIDEGSSDANSLSIYPNPTNQACTVFYHLGSKADTKFELVDLLGKKIKEIGYAGQPEGDYTINLSKEELGLNNGIYFIRLTVNDNTVTKKLIITQ